MQSLRGSPPGRVRWVVAFALLLLVATATPVLADPSGEVPEESPSAAEVPAPSASELAAVEHEEREHAEWLASPEAARQREASEAAYTSLSAGEAQSLLLEAFPAQLRALNADPARVLTELEIEKQLGTYGARVTTPDGESAIVESSVPVESDLGGEGKEPVDLELQSSGEGFTPQNPLTEVQLPGSAEEPIQLQSGVEVGLPTSNDHGAEALGDMNLFYPETETATDTLVSPIAGGVEVFEQLRSAESPESFSFALSLPAGASLRANEEGGAEVISSSGERIEKVPIPTAVDAQGAEVPVRMSVEGDSLLLEVPHRSREVAYPLLVDPSVSDSPSFYSGEWLESRNAEYELHNNGSSLAAISRKNYTYPANTNGQWVYAAPGQTSFIEEAVYSNVYFLVNGCSNTQPHGYLGIYNVNTQSYGGLGVFSGGYSYSPSYSTGRVGGSGYRDAMIGIGTAGSSINIGCTHEIYVGGVTLLESDPENPTINSVSGVPSGWFNPAKAGEVTIVASDPGFGIKEMTIYDGKVTNTHPIGCTGLSGSRCPGQANWTVPPPYEDGERTLRITAEDALRKGGEWTATTKVDSTAPEVDLEGQLATVTKEEGKEEQAQSKGNDELHLPVYNLQIKATDGSNAEGKTKRSGVKNIEILLDGHKQEVPWQAQSCPNSSCPMEKTYQLQLVGLESGTHKLKVIVEDQVENKREREIEFQYFPATGMKDEYVMQYFPLPDGQGSESEEEHPNRPELAVNVTNGNLVYRQKDVEVTGPAVNLEVERFYNSQLPASESTEWGKGWTLGQTPKLEPEKVQTPSKATMLRTSGTMQGAVGLPTKSGAQQFDANIQSTVAKEPSGYAVTDESGETEDTLAFSEAGKTTELSPPGPASVEYGYEGANLAEISTVDPAATSYSPEELKSLVEPYKLPTYQSSFGAAGTGGGQFSHPGDVAIDPKGNLWVIDTTNNRVEKFSEAGTFTKTFGWGVSNGESKLQVCTASCRAGISGSGNGQFNHPTALATDPKGNVWVTDTANNRVEEFNESGTYLTKFGSAGTGNGQFAGPEGIAVAPNGNLWVSDTNHGRLEEFNEKGEFIRVVGSSGSGSGQLGRPTGIDIGPGGNVWVADRQNNRVSEFTEAGTFVRQFGSVGSGNGQLSSPGALGIDSWGNVWVGDQGNGRVEEFSEGGTYLNKFGAKGSGQGQFNFSYPLGVAIDAKGDIWVTDTGNNRVQKWLFPSSVLRYRNTVGAKGSGNGQFAGPEGIAVAPNGNLWVSDSGNNRIEKLNEKGEFLAAFGTQGSGNGQFSDPMGIAIAPGGNIWVADSGNGRVEELSEKGEYLASAGSSGEGKLSWPTGIAVDAKGNVWVVDDGNSRLEEFNEKGQFLKSVGEYGYENGKFIEPYGVAIGRSGNIFVVGHELFQEVEEFNEKGEYVTSFGEGFGWPMAIAADAGGNLWVADSGNNRIQEFSEKGKSLAQFGSEGAGDEQLSYPEGVAVDYKGDVWVADTGNNRLQEWRATPKAQEVEANLIAEDGPAAEVNVSSGLVSSVEGKEAGQTTYTHTGEMLTAVKGPETEASYEYDEAKRLKKVSLPNGTWGEVKYDSMGRVTAVTVSVEGAKAKTTTFEYSNEPRETTVRFETEPAVHYQIGEDGSVLKWWNAKTPPVIEPLMGSLWNQRGEVHPEPISPGDQNLLVRAYSAEGIASIQIVANGNQVVAECGKGTESGTECAKEESKSIKEWVTETENWPPGTLQLEVIVTDSIGGTSSQRFWDNIPYTPPPSEEELEPPKFEEVKSYREEHGLDLDLKGNEAAINERIFSLIAAWHSPNTPEGEVARATEERWGVPLRAADAAELEYRIAYWKQAESAITAWANGNAPSTFAGFYLDERAGGLIRVGFTSEQESLISALKQQGGLMAPSRITAFSSPPSHSLASLKGLEAEVITAASGYPEGLITGVSTDIPSNSIEVGTTNVAQATTDLHGTFGTQAPITIVEHAPRETLSGRNRIHGRMLAGDRIILREPNTNEWECTAGFGAFEGATNQSTGAWVWRHFLLTAAHCAVPSSGVRRQTSINAENPNEKEHLGTITRYGFEPLSGRAAVDTEGMRFEENEGITPRQIYPEEGFPNVDVKGMGIVRRGTRVCASGATSGEVEPRAKRIKCGEVISSNPVWFRLEGHPVYEWCYNRGSRPGDSGAPIWIEGTGTAVGILSSGGGGETCFQALSPDSEFPEAPSVFGDPRLGAISLSTQP